MHRSTTSLAASILAGAGIHLGDDLMAAGAGNEVGHFKDNEFYLLHQRILAANGLSLEGFTIAERIDVPATLHDQAVALVARRRAAGRPWGWKDPRTVLFLDFWADLVPEARWLFVVRPPWEVVDSLFRRGDTAFRAERAVHMADRDALVAQLDAERGIYETLRQDLTGRIEAARAGRRKAG